MNPTIWWNSRMRDHKIEWFEREGRDHLYVIHVTSPFGRRIATRTVWVTGALFALYALPFVLVRDYLAVAAVLAIGACWAAFAWAILARHYSSLRVVGVTRAEEADDCTVVTVVQSDGHRVTAMMSVEGAERLCEQFGGVR